MSLLHSSFSIEFYKTSETGSYKIITIVHFICSLLTFKISNKGVVELGNGSTAGQIPDLFAADTVSSCVDLFCVNFSHIFLLHLSGY